MGFKIDRQVSPYGKEMKLSALNMELNDLYWMFKNGAFAENDYIRLRDRINKKICEVRKED